MDTILINGHGKEKPLDGIDISLVVARLFHLINNGADKVKIEFWLEKNIVLKNDKECARLRFQAPNLTNTAIIKDGCFNFFPDKPIKANFVMVNLTDPFENKEKWKFKHEIVSLIHEARKEIEAILS